MNLEESLFHAMPGLFLVASKQGRIVRVNPRLCAHLQYEEATLATMHLADIGADNCFAAIQSQTGTEVAGVLTDTQLRRRDGQHFEVKARISPLEGRNEFLVCLQPVHEHVETLDSPGPRQDSLDMLHTLSRVQSQFIVDGNPRDSFKDLLTEMLRLTKSEYGFIGEVFSNEEGQPYLKAHAITNIAWSAETRAVFDKNAATGLEFRNLKSLFGEVMTTARPVISNHPSSDPRRGGLPHGHPRMDAFLGLPFLRSGRLIGMIGIANRPGGYDESLVQSLEPLLTTCAALTEAFRSERRRHQASRELDAAQASLAAALGVGGIGLWTWHPAEGRVAWHESAIELFGRKMPEPAQEALEVLKDTAHPADRSRLGQALEQVVVEGASLNIEFRMLQTDGRLVWLSVKGEMENDEHGNPLRMSNAAVDITQRKMLEEQLRQSQKMEAIGQLAGGVAHDFNNLLTVVEGHASYMGGHLDFPHELRPSIEALGQVIHLGAKLTRQLLTFSRRQVAQLRPVCVNEVIQDHMRMLHRMLTAQIDVQTHLADPLPLVEGDPAMLEQVLLNLAVNAQDAMPEGGTLVIETGVVTFAETGSGATKDQPHGVCVRLSVTDTGTGIAPEHLERVFEPFFTTKDVGKGTGLGLATVYGIVKQHQGWISVRSDAGRGTTFEILLRASEETTVPPTTKAR